MNAGGATSVELALDSLVSTAVSDAGAVRPTNSKDKMLIAAIASKLVVGEETASAMVEYVVLLFGSRTSLNPLSENDLHTIIFIIATRLV